MSEKMKEYHSYNNACKGFCICVNIININPVVSFQSEPGSKALASSESRICLPAKQAGLAFAGEVFVRDFSPLKAVLIQGKWQRWTSLLVPAGFAGTTRRGNTG